MFSEADVQAVELVTALREVPLESPENIGADLQELRDWVRDAGLPPAWKDCFEVLNAGDPVCWAPDSEWNLFCESSETKKRRGNSSDASQIMAQLEQGVTESTFVFFHEELLARQENVMAVVSHFGTLTTMLFYLFGVELDVRQCKAVRVRFAFIQETGEWIWGPPEST